MSGEVMECVCGFDSCNDEESAAFCDIKNPVARKAHTCCECGRVIVPGERYERVVGKWDTEIEAFTTCAECAEIREALCLGNWTYTTLWEDIRDQAFPDLTTKCIDKLSRAARKVFILAYDEWLEGQED